MLCPLRLLAGGAVLWMMAAMPAAAQDDAADGEPAARPRRERERGERRRGAPESRRHRDGPRGEPGRGRPDGRRRPVPSLDELLAALRAESETVRANIAERREAGSDVPESLSDSAEGLELRIEELERLRERRDRRGPRGPGGPRGGPPWRGSDDSGRRPGFRRGPFGPGGPRGGRFGPPEMSREEAMELLEEIAPGRLEQMRRRWGRDGRGPGRGIGPFMPELLRLRGLRERDPEAFERAIRERRLEHEVGDLAARAGRAKGDEREALLARLRQQLMALFDVRMQDRDAQIKQLEDRLNQLRGEQEERKQQRDDLIDRRLKEMLGEAVDF